MSISFQLKDDGMNEYHGDTYMEDEFLVIETQRRSVFGTSEETETLKVEYAALDDISFKKNFWGDRITIHPRTRDFFKSLPKHYHLESTLVLKTKKKERSLAKKFVDKLEDRILFGAEPKSA